MPATTQQKWFVDLSETLKKIYKKQIDQDVNIFYIQNAVGFSNGAHAGASQAVGNSRAVAASALQEDCLLPKVMSPPDEVKLAELDKLIKTNAEAYTLLNSVFLTMSNNKDFKLQARLIVRHIVKTKSILCRAKKLNI